MTSNTDQKQRDASEPSHEAKLAELYGLIEKIEIAMMITRMPSGAMAARPMSRVTGEAPKVGVKRELDSGDLHRGR